MIVLDTSAAVEYFLNTAKGQAVAPLLKDTALYAPQHLVVEFLQVLRKAERQGLITALEANQAIQDFTDMPINFIDLTWLVTPIWAYHHRVSAYDAAYLALADRLDCALITFDQRLGQVAARAAIPE